MEASPETVAEEMALNCPLCGYDLRGLPSQRCPECGHAFDPEEIRRAIREKSNSSFEHASRHVVRAFLKTAALTLRPLAFWKRLAAASRIVPRRLKVWALVWFSLFVLVAGSSLALLCVNEYVTANANNRTITSNISRLGTFTSNGRTYAYLRSGVFVEVLPASELTLAASSNRVLNSLNIAPVLPLIVAVLAWPPVTVLTFKLFGITLRRAGIHKGHLWRCVLYGWPIAVVPVAFIVEVVLVLGLHVRNPYELPWPAVLLARVVPRIVWQIAEAIGFWPLELVGLSLFIVISTIHLAVAHVRYLRLPQAIAQALLIQTVSCLSILALIYLMVDVR